MTQQSAGRHVAPHYPDSERTSLYSYSCKPHAQWSSGEVTNTNFIILSVIGPGHEFMIYRTRGEHANHYDIDAITGCIGMTVLIKATREPSVSDNRK